MGAAEFQNYGFEEYKFPFEVHFLPIVQPEDDVKRFKYAGLKPSSAVLKKGDVKAPGLRALPADMIYDRDVKVPMRDGVTCFTDVFRPTGDEKVPAILLFSPYGKTGTGDMG